MTDLNYNEGKKLIALLYCFSNFLMFFLAHALREKVVKS